ncbi:sugar O-acetyltransferase [Corynebacterium tapiri]|nr:sugar O-acetyltransferase [Corynebacterium tapiri]
MDIHSTDPKYYTFERMTSGQWYLPGGPEQEAQHDHVRPLLKQVNELANTDLPRAWELLGQVLAEGSEVPEWWSPVWIEYGCNTRFGPGCFVNAGMTILDSAPVTVGARSLFGPNCELITVGHPVNDVEMRMVGWELAKPITIGDDCWFGSSVHVMPGVTIGDRCVIAAGTVVTKDVPDDSLVAGVPGRILRSLVDAPLERNDIDF